MLELVPGRKWTVKQAISKTENKDGRINRRC